MRTKLTLLSVLCAAAVAAPSLVFAAEGKIDFKKDVEPILKQSCIKCHGLNPKHPKQHAAGKFRLDNEKDAMKGGKDGVMIVPGDAKGSILYQLLSGPVKSPDPDNDRDIDPMPKAKKGEKFKPLSDDQIATIKSWIDQGAKWD